MFGNVAIPQGSVYPDGLDVTVANPVIQSTVRPEGSYFVKSAGYASIRNGRTKFQNSHGMGIHFTPMTFAENLESPNQLPLMVNSTTAADHADVADLPGSENLTMDGQINPADAATGGGVLMSEPSKMAPEGGNVIHRGRKTLPDMGDREPHRPLTQLFHGLAHPVELFKGEYAVDPLMAIAAAAGITAIAWSIGRDFERSYRSRERSASAGGGLTGEAAPVAAAPAAATETSGKTVSKVADTAVEATEAVADAAGAVVETAAGAVETVTETVADAVTE
jgi:hypothetical protein